MSNSQRIIEHYGEQSVRKLRKVQAIRMALQVVIGAYRGTKIKAPPYFGQAHSPFVFDKFLPTKNIPLR